MSAAADWVASAPAGFKAFMDRLTWHHQVAWDVPDYVGDDELGPGGDGRRTTTDLEQVEAISSSWREQRPQNQHVDDAGNPVSRHGLLIDLDVAAWLIPSSTAGHGHLYVDLDLDERDLWEFLEAAAKIGLVEDGYVSACRSRGMTSVRAPWVRKGFERSPVDAAPFEDVSF